jgi:hypothetical protein
MPADLIAMPEAARPYWEPLVEHDEQTRLWMSPARHRVLAAGRGGGKTENGARITITGDEHHAGALLPPDVPQPLFIICAPTHDQVRKIWWKRLKAMVPNELLLCAPRETDMELRMRSGATIQLAGLDKPARIEGAMGVDGLVIDEYAEVRRDAWESSLEPALNRRGRKGWALFLGRPKGRGHFFDLWSKAKARDGWDSFHWTSEPVLGKAHLEEQRANMDDRVFRQEFLADWVTFQGLAYYQWKANLHYRGLSYDPKRPLVVCFDFNIEPGITAILQEQDHKHAPTGDVPIATTCAIDEVWIEKDSNTPEVCRRLLRKIRDHSGDVFVYGDATGGAGSTTSDATNWEIVKQHLQPVFGDRLRWRVARSNPHIRDRVNAVNQRLQHANGTVRFLADPVKCPRIVADFEGVTVKDDGSGDIDKKGCERRGLTHLSEAIGYYIHEKFPVQGRSLSIV